jgi:pimeloyl-ACP methyl ester carboxylesterase
VPDIGHRTLTAEGARVHLVESGEGGTSARSTVLLVHGFPETWFAFRHLIPLLAEDHRVLAVDLPGFGESQAPEPLDSARHAAVLAELIEQLDAGGPVHLLGQDVSGALTYRLAATRPDLVASWTAVETVLPGFGFEALAAAVWYVPMLAAPGVPELLLPGRERAFLADHVLGPQARVGLGDVVVAELSRAYEKPGGFVGAASLYRSLLAEGGEIHELAATPLAVPVLAVSGSAGELVSSSVRGVAPCLEPAAVAGVGHYVALEAPERLAAALRSFFARTTSVDGVSESP